jgi:hypothetical protein
LQTHQKAADIIYREVVSDDSDVRAEFFKYFEVDARRFSQEMGGAVLEWMGLDQGVESQDKAIIAAIVHAAITMNTTSFKLFLSGHIVASGNVFRQCIEAIALGLLCSDKDLPMRGQFLGGTYSTKNAVRDVSRHWKRLGLIAGAQEQLQNAQQFYGQYSHLTLLAIATMIPRGGDGSEAYVGAAFDDAKLDAYRKEINGRVGLSKVFPNFIRAIRKNVSTW